MTNPNQNSHQNSTVPMLLTTKLNMPLPKSNLVIRQALLDRLNEGLANNSGLFLVSAPAGYGKTTLVSEWRNSESFRHTWLSLDKKDNDPVRFLTYLLAAIRKIDPEAGQTTQSLFSLPQLPAVEILITPLINDLADLKEHMVLIIDDYHLVHTSYIHDIIQFILDFRTSYLHLVLITREDPPLTFARLRANREITEIRAGDLRFSQVETTAFLADTMQLNLKDEAITILCIVTEGWIVGLQLAALSFQGHDPEEIERSICDFSGNNRYIIEYLVAEVLANLPAEIRAFLHQTAVLDRLCAPLCNTITGREDSQDILELLERGNFFLFPLDDQRQWYRYHHLFADSLRMELNREERQAVHQKASHWYEVNGYLEEAVPHAIAADDYQEAGHLIFSAALNVFANNKITTLKNWLDALPDDFIRTNGELALCKMYVLYSLGQIDTVEPYINAFKNDRQAQFSVLNRSLFSNICSLLANKQEDSKALDLAKEALELAKGENSVIVSIGALNTYGSALFSAGNLTETIKVFREVLRLTQKWDYSFFKMYALYHLLLSLELNGRLSEAIRLGENAIAKMVDHHGLPLPLVKIIYIPLGIFYYKANVLEQSLKYLIHGINESYKLSINGLVNSEHILAMAYNAAGDSQQALLTIHKAIQGINQSTQQSTTFNYMAQETELLLRKGDLKVAIDWAEYWRLTPDDKPGLLKEQSYFTFIRLLLAQERFQEALNLLDYFENSTKAGQRYSRLITVNILQALTYHLTKNEIKSIQYLSYALKLAAPEGYYRPFLDEGPVLAKLLLKIKDQAPDFIERLLVDFESTGINDSSSFQNNIFLEPLTKRELEILHLVSDGLSNNEIADNLLIATGTVRKHLEKIFRKLSAQSRTQALANAKKTHLL